MDYTKRLMLLSSSERKSKASKALRSTVLRKSKDNKERICMALKASSAMLEELAEHLRSADKLLNDNNISSDDKFIVADYYSCKYGQEVRNGIDALKSLADDCSKMLAAMNEMATASWKQIFQK